MNLKRIGAWVSVCFVAAVALVGCNKNTPAVSEKVPVLAVEAAKSTESNVSVAQPPNLSSAKLAAVDFLDMLGSDNPKVVDRVAVSFRKQTTSLFFPHELSLGYSDSDTFKFLQKQFNRATAARIQSESRAPGGQQIEFRGVLDGRDPMNFALRMTAEGGNWLVSRFSATNKLQAGILTDASNPELAWARESAVDFLESWLGGEREYYTLSMAMMTNELKSRLPSPSVHDDGLTYSRKDVRNWLNQGREGVTGFAINKESLEPGAATFDGEIIGKDKRRSFHLVLRSDQAEWLVDACDVK